MTKKNVYGYKNKKNNMIIMVKKYVEAVVFFKR